jgi:hypothetical protein
MRSLLLLTLFVLAPFTYADVAQTTIQTRVVGIDQAEVPGQDHLVMLSNDGRVGFLSPSNLEILQTLLMGVPQNTEFAVTLDANHYITAVKALTSPKPEAASSSQAFHPLDVAENYTPTLVANDQVLNAIFAELNPNWSSDTQCYDKAEVWSYEEFNKRNLHSKKVFLFFTSKYIREFRYQWWFHVSPFVLVNENGVTHEKVIDETFLATPTDIDTWTQIFMQPKMPCPSVDHYSDYANHQNESYCYVIKTSMYFWQPKDIQALESGTPAKTSFPAFDVKTAYSDGFH